jgi:hypothetical protein
MDIQVILKRTQKNILLSNFLCFKNQNMIMDAKVMDLYALYLFVNVLFTYLSFYKFQKIKKSTNKK